MIEIKIPYVREREDVQLDMLVHQILTIIPDAEVKLVEEADHVPTISIDSAE